jgi:5-amino-6-(5-phosphoribosylamino)uracil reductase
VTDRPYVLLSCAMSVDGCLDAPGEDRLILSGSEDLDRVDGERAASDAIMVGAGTLRRDNPLLLIRSPARRAWRAARGMPEHPAGVTLTATGDLDPGARFFAGRDGPGPPAPPARSGTARLVYCASPVAAALRARLAGLAEVADAGTRPSLPAVLTDLARRGVRRLMVEGGARLGSQFLAAGLVDELHLVVAPVLVGDPAAPRFAPPARYPHGPGHPMVLAEVRRLGPVVLLRYLLDGNGQAPAGFSAALAAPWGPAGD